MKIMDKFADLIHNIVSVISVLPIAIIFLVIGFVYFIAFTLYLITDWLCRTYERIKRYVKKYI